MLAGHVAAQKMGRTTFYEEYRVRIARVEREYNWKRKDLTDTQDGPESLMSEESGGT